VIQKEVRRGGVQEGVGEGDGDERNSVAKCGCESDLGCRSGQGFSQNGPEWKRAWVVVGGGGGEATVRTGWARKKRKEV